MTTAGKQWTLEVVDIDPTPAARRLAEQARRMLGGLATPIEKIIRSDLYVIDREPTIGERDALGRAIANPGMQAFLWRSGSAPSVDTGPTVETALRPGVTDPVGEAVGRAATLLGFPVLRARSGARFTFDLGVDEGLVETVASTMLRNAIVDDVAFNEAIVVRFTEAAVSPPTQTVSVRGLSDDALATLSAERGLALDPAELIVVRTYFESIGREPTDAEIETIAQTWSEHCSHKTFRADITWDDGTVIEPLLAQLRRSTNDIDAPFVVSAFVDNAGIVSFDDDVDVAVKVETHNHPSAVEPFGGANTGVGGVIRHVLGVAADPVAVTDVLCFGPLELPIDKLPAGVLHPQRIRHGVIEGIADYGNKLGLPTVAGAVCHQDGFTANPLVFAGCIGLRPKGLVLTGPEPGDRIVALGGATGRDGIRGATFSSATMDATTGDVAGASVQIGDPITEKLVVDVLTEARGYGLFVAITDCGAGGFSSAIGEIAAEFGADVELDAAPRKYPGLAPWEVWLSEAQERMVLAVRPGNVDALAAICGTHGVLMADLGSFRSDGQLVVRADGQLVVDLPGAFLHDGRPTRRLTATRPVPPPPAVVARDLEAIVAGLATLVLQTLAHSDVRSNEDIVRGFDHEILGATIGRPFVGVAEDGPADAAVVSPLVLSSGLGLAIGIGMNCRTGVIDARRMAEACVDEAIRNVVAVGADPDRVALLDNFSWGDPRRPEMLGRLVDAVAGCCAAAGAHHSPFVSGTYSLNNEYVSSDGSRRSIPPTLVITALGVVPEAERLVTSDAKGVDNVVVLVGDTADELRSGVLDAVLGVDGPGGVPGGDSSAPERYRAVHRAMVDGLVHSAHDVSDGGLVAALAEMAMGGRLGALVDLDAVSVRGAFDSGSARIVAAMFSESSGRILLEVSPDRAVELCARTGGHVIATFTDEDLLVVMSDGVPVVELSMEELLRSWRGHVS